MCGLELPELEATIHQRYADQGVRVFAVHRGENVEQLAAFVEQTGITFPLIEDERNTLGDLDFADGVGYPYPRDVVVGKDLTIRSIRNSFSAEEMDALVVRLLAE